MIKNLFVLIHLGLLTTLTTNLLAQTSEYPNAIAIRGNAINYHYPITQDVLRENFTPGMEFQYIRHLSKALNIAVPIKLGQGKLPLNKGTDFDTKNGLLSGDVLLQLKTFKADRFFNPYLFGGIGATFEDYKEYTFAAPLGLGFNFKISPTVHFNIQGEYRLGLEDYRDNAQIGAGFLFLIKGGKGKIDDMDGDGVADIEDLCPDEPGRKLLNGCPDKDRDGVTDKEDQCPDAPGLKSLYGCPDKDNDGITDAQDACPNESGTLENRGCPLKDKDGDGIEDDKDNCPEVAGTRLLAGCPDKDGDGVADKNDDCPNVSGPKSLSGCPDSDNDGILDKDDRCPQEAGIAANNGCPGVLAEVKETLEFAAQAVQFETGSSRLKSTSEPILDKIISIMRQYPNYNMRIGGHTDSIGSSSQNQKLSESRAKACYDYMVSQGISASRMSYKGYGEKEPIADNRYKDGREKNRRVVFDIYLP